MPSHFFYLNRCRFQKTPCGGRGSSSSQASACWSSASWPCFLDSEFLLCCVPRLSSRQILTQDRPGISAPWQWPLVLRVKRGSTGATRSAVIVSVALALTWFDCVHCRQSVSSMSGIMILGVCEHQTRRDKPDRAPSVGPCLGLASGDFGLRCWSAARHRTISRARPTRSDPAGRGSCQVGLAEVWRRRGAVRPSH